MRSDYQPITGFGVWPRQLVDRDALNAAAVTALTIDREDRKVDDVRHLLRQVPVTAFLADFLSNHAVPDPFISFDLIPMS